MDRLIVLHVTTRGPEILEAEGSMRVVKTPCIEPQTLTPSALRFGAVLLIRPLQHSLLTLSPSQSEI